MARAAAPVVLSPAEVAELERVLRVPSSPQQAVTRARVVLRAAAGATNREIAREVGLSELAVGRWRTKFGREGLAGLADRPRTGRPRSIDDATVQQVIAKTLEPPPAGESHWSVRRLAQATGLASATVHRIWRQHRLQPHRTRTFKYSTDPELEAKVIDIVGLYLDPPEGALVLCVDEKTQIQALDRPQPILPLGPGLPEGRTHDYRRHGTTSLYAALEVATGQVMTDCHPRHRAEEFLRFLRRIVREYPSGELHLVLDNSSTHTTPEVKAWLARHRRVHFHFTPKGASWMNLVESWFSILTRRSVRRGSYQSVAELIASIERFVAGYNDRAQPFVWTKPAGDVLAKASKPTTTSETEH
ncbi:MAG: IS630 family transposase [Actinobacteria bacterium]|nr:IS630 family transposase [Actinomycetota bacterium]